LYYIYLYIYIYIYITRLASNRIFSPSNKIHREVRQAKDLSALRFDRDGITNFNQHQCARGNPYGTIHDRHQLQVRISVWAGIVGDCLVGSHILPQCLTGNVDRDFLLNGLPQVLELVPLAVRAWYMRDGAPARFSRPVQDMLDNAYHDKWIGRAILVAWSARWPNLSPLDFYSQGHFTSPSVFSSK
jgi:hypothetical protein